MELKAFPLESIQGDNMDLLLFSGDGEGGQKQEASNVHAGTEAAGKNINKHKGACRSRAQHEKLAPRTVSSLVGGRYSHGGRCKCVLEVWCRQKGAKGVAGLGFGFGFCVAPRRAQ